MKKNTIYLLAFSLFVCMQKSIAQINKVIDLMTQHAAMPGIKPFAGSVANAPNNII